MLNGNVDPVVRGVINLCTLLITDRIPSFMQEHERDGKFSVFVRFVLTRRSQKIVSQKRFPLPRNCVNY